MFHSLCFAVIFQEKCLLIKPILGKIEDREEIVIHKAFFAEK